MNLPTVDSGRGVPLRLAAAAMAFSASVLAVMPAQANLLDTLFGGGSKGIDCAVRDEACIRQAGLDNAIAAFKARSHAPNIEPYVRYATQFTMSAPEDIHEDMRGQWRRAGADETFFERLDEELREFAPPPVDAEEFDGFLWAQEAPAGEEFATYARRSFAQLRETDPQKALEIWNTHFRVLWEMSFGSVTDMHAWMANNDLDALEAYSADFIMPRSGRYDPWETLSYAAADHCNGGRTESGLRILDILDNEIGRWPDDRDRRAIDSSKLTRAILACQGEETAMALIDPMLELMEREMEAARVQFTNERERDFVLGVIESEVAENMIQPLALWLNEEGRRDEAIEVFQRLPPRATSMGFSDVANGDILSMQFIEQSFDELVEFQKDAGLYSADPRAALTHYVEEFETDFSICCVDQDIPLDMMEQTAELWPEDIARRAANKTIALYTDYAAREPDNQHLVDHATLVIAAMEQSHGGCSASDETLQAILDTAPDYRFDDQRVRIMLAYVDYLRAPTGNGQAESCIIP